MGARERSFDRVEPARRVGPDSQVDDKAVLIPPGAFGATDPFLLLSEDWFSSPGFDWHPHRGIETVTVVLDGALEHGDNHGNAGVLGPGGVQWMTAGEGIVHRELAYRDEHAHTLQLWVNLPASHKLAHARYQDLGPASHAVLLGPGTRVRVVSGSLPGAEGPAQRHWPVTVLTARIEPGSTLEVPLPGADRAFCYLRSGRLDAGPAAARLPAGAIGWSDPAGPGESVLALAAPEGDEVCELVLASGPPIGEPVVAYGPFVMNTEDEIRRAFADYQRGRFGAVPALARVVDAPLA